MTNRELQLAHQKTKAVMLTKWCAHNPPRLCIGGVSIAISSHIRYLGVILDTRLSFGKHVREVAKKAFASAVALARLMLNISGPSRMKRRLISSVVKSQLLYAALIWSPSVDATAKFKMNLRRPQRVATLRTIREYRSRTTQPSI
jgi:hypothetical protein